MKPLLIVKTASSFDDLPSLCAQRGDEVRWFSEACGLVGGDVVAVDAYRGAALPDPTAFLAIIITGSLDMISDNLPWMIDTAEWLKGALDKQVPILGVCFGHHLLAQVLGGEVGRNPNGAEFGAVEIEQSAAAAEDPIFKGLPKDFKMHVFHYESILDLPTGAVMLASNAHDENHAVRYGKNAWGVQFHPEFDPEIMDSAIDIYKTDMEDANYDIETLREENVDQDFGRILLKNFINEAYAQ